MGDGLESYLELMAREYCLVVLSHGRDEDDDD